MSEAVTLTFIFQTIAVILALTAIAVRARITAIGVVLVKKFNPTKK